MGLAGCVVTSYLAPVASIGPSPHTVPVPCDSLYTRYQILLLPGVTAPQQGSGGLPEFTYKPLQREDGSAALSAGEQQHRRLQNQHLEPQAQSVQPFSVHQHSLRVARGAVSVQLGKAVSSLPCTEMKRSALRNRNAKYKLIERCCQGNVFDGKNKGEP